MSHQFLTGFQTNQNVLVQAQRLKSQNVLVLNLRVYIMSLNASKLVALGVASYTVATDAELSVYAGCTAALLVMTHWSTAPAKESDARKYLAKMATDNGIPLTDWQDKVGAVFKVASKLASKMPSDPLLLASRDATDELQSLLAMKDLFTVKGLTCRHYFKQWSKVDSVDKFDPEAAKREKAAKEASKLDAIGNMVSNINASSEALLKAAQEKAVQDTAAIEALTPLQRFALDVAAISDAAMLDAMHVALNARQAELAAIAAAATATMDKPSEPVVPRGKRAAARRMKAIDPASLPAALREGLDEALAAA